jgi:hypothetical protein
MRGIIRAWLEKILSNSSLIISEQTAVGPTSSSTSGNPDKAVIPNGRPLKALAQISIDKELGDQPCPEKIWKAIERQIPGCFPAEWKPPTWLQAEVVKNRIKAMSLTRGDAMAIARWQMADGKPRIQISGPEGGPIQLQSFDLKKLTDQELRLWRELAIKAAITPAE